MCGLKQKCWTKWKQKKKSHPAWVCGLKRWYVGSLLPFPWSHPAWVCGLKQSTYNRQKPWQQSHPAWVCGLKLLLLLLGFYQMGHTLRGCVDWNYWWLYALVCLLKSHPAWVCGLKLFYEDWIHKPLVTPCVGVWIETIIVILFGCFTLSHPAWVCGLKHFR